VLDNVSAFQGDKHESGRSLLVWPGLPRSLTGAVGVCEASLLFRDG